MKFASLLYGLNLLLILNTAVNGRRLRVAAEESDKSERKSKSLKGNHKKSRLGSKDDSSQISKRQFMFRPYMTNYPILKPPPIRHFVVHHHAS